MIMRELVREHGAAIVWVVGWRVLKFPPTWLTTGKELFLLSNALRG